MFCAKAPYFVQKSPILCEKAIVCAQETYSVQKMHVTRIHDAGHMRERVMSQMNEPRQTLQCIAWPRIAKDICLRERAKQAYLCAKGPFRTQMCQRGGQLFSFCSVAV